MAPVVESAPARPGLIPATAAEKRIALLLDRAGIRMGGSRPWDIQVHDRRFFHSVLTAGTLGAGESYVDGWWDVDALDEFVARMHRADPYRSLAQLPLMALALKAKLFNRQRREPSKDVARRHYDLGNNLYEAMLGRSMQYTCGYWAHAHDLDQAQEHKLHLIARKLYVERGMSVLDLGGGFGGLAHFLASEYGCRVVVYNISAEQVAYARRLCAGLPVRVEQRDYRDAAHEREPFDRVAAIGLCEHIGHKNHRGLFELVRSRLRDHGLFLLHTIGSNESVTFTDPWIDRYIFPNGMVPSAAQLARAMEGLWILEDWHNFGPDYDRTLMSWWANFDRAWPRLSAAYGERFYRMWRYYLLGSAGTFRARKLQLWQLVLSKGDIDLYRPVR